jgi:hypothetical protein
MQILIFVWCLQKLKPRHRPGHFCVCITATNVFRLMTSSIGTKRTSRDVRSLIAIGGKADMAVASADFRI